MDVAPKESLILRAPSPPCHTGGADPAHDRAGVPKTIQDCLRLRLVCFEARKRLSLICSDDIKEFKVLPHRWVVERTFGWLLRQRRLVRDYETTDSSAEALVYIAMIRIQLRRLA